MIDAYLKNLNFFLVVGGKIWKFICNFVARFGWKLPAKRRNRVHWKLVTKSLPI